MSRSTARPRSRPVHRGAAVILVVALFAAACSSGDPIGSEDDTDGTDPGDPAVTTPTDPLDSEERTDRLDEDAPFDENASLDEPTPPPMETYVVPPPTLGHDVVEPVGFDPDRDTAADDGTALMDAGDGDGDGDGDDLIEIPGDEIVLGFSSPMDLVGHGVELGVWSRAEGVIALMRIRLGEAPASSVEGLELVRSHSWTALFRAAEELVADPATTVDETTELTRLLDALTPDETLIEAVMAAATPIDPDSLPGAEPVDPEEGTVDEDRTGMQRPGRRATRTVGTIAPEPAASLRPITGDGDCLNPRLTEYPLIEPVEADCWRAISATVPSPHGGESAMSVLYSEEHAEFAEASLEALIRTVRAGHAWSTATTSSHLVIAPSDLPIVGPIAGVETTADGVGGVAQPIGSFCFIAMSVADGVEVSDAYRQVVAHEQVHCLQFEDHGYLGGSENDWIVEGGADYFSHVVYPTGRAERQHIPAFINRSLTEPLMAMDYPVWIWWQYLGDRTSPAEVFRLHRRMIRGDAVAVLAAEPGMAEIFHEFTIDLLRAGIPTMSDPIPASGRSLPHGLISTTGTRTETVGQFVAARVAIFYRRDHRFEQTDATVGAGRHDVVARSNRPNRAAWGPFPPVVRAGCEEALYVMALTTIAGDPHTVTWNIDEVDEDRCDPCLVGTWLLDNEVFADTIIRWAAQQGGGLPDGFDIAWEIIGPYYQRFTADNSGVAWREGWQMVFSGSAQGITVGAVTTIDSLETFSFATDDDRIDITDSVTVFSTATVETIGPGGAPFISATDTRSSAFGEGEQTSGTYTCTPVELTIALDEAPDLPLRWTRATDAPDPPPAG